MDGNAKLLCQLPGDTRIGRDTNGVENIAGVIDRIALYLFEMLGAKLKFKKGMLNQNHQTVGADKKQNQF